MNSSLQCLAHCVPLLRVFLSSSYRRDINLENPLGYRGEVANAFANLMELMWRGGLRSVVPRGFKRTLAQHTHLCQGAEQHDSQDLLSVLLDMLHEDLNRVKNKPYTEEAEDAGEPDAELAATAWDTHLCAPLPPFWLGAISTTNGYDHKTPIHTSSCRQQAAYYYYYYYY